MSKIIKFPGQESFEEDVEFSVLFRYSRTKLDVKVFGAGKSDEDTLAIAKTFEAAAGILRASINRAEL